MTTLDTDNLEHMIDAGYIRQRVHPDNPNLHILNYAEKAQYEKEWNHETLTCRGLIVDGNEIVARPWPKFFNYEEHKEGALDLSVSVEVTDKADGSLGILYDAPDGPAIATRGSFVSEQALHATSLLRNNYPAWAPLPDFTYLFEIVYPDNRIVLDYGQLDDLILLGAIHIPSGKTFGPTFDNLWSGPRTSWFTATTLADALKLAPRDNAEGIVVRDVDGTMVKIKQDDYVRLHRLVTGLSERSVWEHLKEHDKDYSDLLAAIPDEFHEWVRTKADCLNDRHLFVMYSAYQEFFRIVESLPVDHTRKQFAALAVQAPDTHLLFQILDGYRISPTIWKMLKPVGNHPMKPVSEDTA